MTTFRKILATLEEGPAESAVAELAGRLARHPGATVALLNVIPDVPWYARLVLPSAEELDRLMIEHQQERLEAIAAPIRQEGGRVAATWVRRGRPATVIVREVVRGEHDLLIQGAPASDDGAPTATVMQLLRDCPCPVWLVRPGGAAPVRRILAAVDLVPGDARHESLNARVLDLAAAVAETEGGELHVAHAWHLPGEGMLRSRSEWVSREQVDAYLRDMEAEIRRGLDDLLARRGRRLDPDRAHLLRGDPPDDALATFVAANAIDVLVIGTVARAGVPGLVIGNTAEAVVRRVGCSVLTVKPDGFVSPTPAEASPAGAE